MRLRASHADARQPSDGPSTRRRRREGRGWGPFTGGQLTTIVCVAIVAAVVGYPMFASAVGSGGNTIHGCANKTSGALRRLNTGQKCSTTTETAVNWSIKRQMRYGRALASDPAGLAEVKSRVGDTKLKWMLRQRNLTIFPNLQIIDISSAQLRTWRPLSADRMFMSFSSRMVERAKMFRMSSSTISTFFPASGRPDWTFDTLSASQALHKQFGVITMTGFGFSDDQPCLVAAGGLLIYLQETLKSSLIHLRRLKPFLAEQFLALDEVTRRSLELTRTLRDGSHREGLQRTTYAGAAEGVANRHEAALAHHARGQASPLLILSPGLLRGNEARG